MIPQSRKICFRSDQVPGGSGESSNFGRWIWYSISRINQFNSKAMVPIGGRPIIWHIMNHYAKFGYNEFVLALGYKADIIKSFFLNYPSLDSNFTINLKSGDVEWHNRSEQDWKVTLIDTGLDSMTGGRLARLKSVIGKETFMLTYGDGVSDVDINALVNYHKK